MICENLSVNALDHLCMAGQDVTDIAKQYQTPLYVMDADRIRDNCRRYRQAMQRHFGDSARVLYAGKAAAFKQMYRIMAQENMWIDAVSSGELYTAQQAGFDLKNAVFHGNNKTDSEIAFAVEHGVGLFAADNTEELLAIDRIAGEHNVRQHILIRLTPGIDTHTYEAVNTGKVDSKFGFAIETGQGEEAFCLAASLPNVVIDGFHCHVGSQVFDSDSFLKSARIMLAFMAHIRDVYGYTARVLDLGGGYGARYTDRDPELDLDANIAAVAQCIRQECEAKQYPTPAVYLEPGRSIVADAGLTLYSVGTVKTIPGYKSYVAIDGGMNDNPRYALYGAQYTVVAAAKMNAACDFTCSLVGRCCESGDVIQPDVQLPADLKRGDLIAVLTTGAYNFSMASAYNRFTRPAVIMLEQGDRYVAVRRETLDDLIRSDV